ncbi:MAG: hypothetical protein IJA30_02490 [Bacilli bacterium]|nr:hypothetical protein [Bacilli bacterium]
MEKQRQIKILSIIALVLAISAMSLGFAAFSTSLKLSSSAMVTPDDATFSVKFSTNKDELIVDDVVPSEISSGLTASNGVIDNSAAPTLKNLSVEFTVPGQYVEYTFYARNEGEYTAYLNNVYFDGQKKCSAGEGVDQSSVDSACSSINLLVYVNGEEYNETTPISGHTLAKGAGDEVKIRISYDEGGSVITDPFNIKFGNIAMIYSTIDDSTYLPPNNTLGKTLLMDIIKEGAVLDTGVAFNTAPTTGTYILNSTSNNANPIYYYRGAVTNNNVKFANFCWKMVRTTETGGIKLIYNGVPAEDGSCDNTGTASQIGTSEFNSSDNSPAYAGYMYGTVYTATTKDLSAQTDTYIYGNDVSWDGTNYTLTGDTKESSSWTTDYKTLATKYHYTCFNDTGICEKVHYINYFGNADNAYYLTLAEGKNIEKAKEEMFTNTTDSKIKTTIDNWYASNMTLYTESLEDTVWCNDRTLTSGPLLSKDNSTGTSIFAAYGRNMSTFKPSISCTNTRDSFTVDSSNGNGKLTYPVGLLTADEYTLAGSGNKGNSTDAYLHTGQYQWSLSPYGFSENRAGGFALGSSGNLYTYGVGTSRGVRPSVSLKPGIYVLSDGDGSVSNPYIVE